MENSLIYIIVLFLLNFVCLPPALVLLRYVKFQEMPRVEMFWLFSSITTWAWIVFLLLSVTDQFGSNIFDTGLWCLAPVFVFTFMLVVLLCEWIYGGFWWSWCYMCCHTSVNRPPPIMFDMTSDEDFQADIKRLKENGPSLVYGRVIETGYLRVNGAKTTYWGLKELAQFPYKSWKDEEVNPAGQDEEGGPSEFPDLENIINSSHPTIIKPAISIRPANEETALKYQMWQKMCAENVPNSGGHIQGQGHELVLDTTKPHRPSRLVANAQLPNFADQSWLIGAKRPWWHNKTLYNIFGLFFLGPIYRVFFYSATIKVVKLQFRKKFSTENMENGVTFENNLQKITLNKFT